MPKFVIEREVPGVGTLTTEQLRESAHESNQVLRELGPDIKWLMSYVTDNKVYCVYVAPDEDIIREHAVCLKLPADRISRVVTTIDPATGE